MSIIIFVEAACFIVALFSLLKDSSFAWRSMVLFLLITCLAELGGKLLKMSHQHNQWIYNIFIIFECGFTSLMFYNILNKYINSKPIILNGLALFVLLYIYEIYQHGFFVFNDITATVMSVVFVIYSFYYFYLLIKDESYIDLKHAPAFWWVAGALLFYFGSTASNLFYNVIVDVRVGGHNITYFIFSTLSIILYSCWSYSFICKKWLTSES